MREFSNDELANLLITKVKQLKAEKAQSQELNEKLEENLAQLEETTSKLEETQEALKLERDNLQKEVKRQTEELLKKEKLSVIGELSARIAHDMRNPITIIKNTVEMMKMNQKEFSSTKIIQWDRLDRAIYRITHQIDDVLDYVQIVPIKKSKQKLSVIIHDAIDRINIPSTVELKLPQNDATLPYDPHKLEIVFVNLIMNAIQAMGDKGGIIIIKILDHVDFVTIEVGDNGPGIPHALQRKIFDPLFTTRQIGTGLGLPSCKNIVEKHGGSIDVSSTRKKGATFLIRLPKKTEWENLSKIGDKEKLTEYITSGSP